MAEENDGNDTESEEPEKKKKPAKDKKKLILLVALGLGVVVASVGGTIVALSMFGGMPAAPVEEEIVEEVVEPKKSPAIYYAIKPAIIVTYMAKGRHRYAQVGVTLMTRDDDVISAIEMHKPMILNALNMVISGQIYDEIQTAEGKELVRLQCLEELQKIMEAEIGKPGIEQVLFTDFVMQ